MSKIIPKNTIWKDLPEGDLLDPGTANEFETGDWRSQRPKHIPENCIQCLFCWIYCPDSAVVVKDGKMDGFNFKHCKGCGICAEVCPAKKKAIVMEEEKKG